MTIQKGYMEQRKFERIAATLKISYRVLEEAEKAQTLTQPRYTQTTAEQLPMLAQKFNVYHAITKDISEGGLSVMGENPFPEAAYVELYLQLPQYNVLLTVLAQVCRTSSFFETGKTMYSAGVKIVAINRDDVVRLERYLLAAKLKQRAGQG